MSDTTERLDVTVVKQGPAAVPAPGEFALGATIGGRYVLEELLGSGGFGHVFRARDSLLGRPVAFKTIQRGRAATAAGNVIDEAKTVAKLDHPHIVPVYDVGVSDGVAWMAMKLIDGEGLDRLLKTRTRLGVEQALRIAAQSADALQHAHRRGIVHRDVKPSNILLTRNDDGSDHVWIADFGIAKLLTGDSTGSSEIIAGTPAYMSPEQITGKRVDARSDVFALGCVAAEMISGARCFKGSSYSEMVYRIVHDQPEGVADIGEIAGEAIERTIRRALAKSPEDRFQTVDEFKSELLRAAGEKRRKAPLWRRLTTYGGVEWDGRDVVVARDVMKSYRWRKPVVRGVDLRVERGAIHAILGRNGSGKTTLLRTLLGFYRREGGEVRIFGRDPERETAAVLARVGYVSDTLAAYDTLRVSDLLQIHRQSYSDWDDALGYEMLGRYELPLDVRIRTLSRGQRTQLGLICALSHRPELLVLDDPTLGLDAVVLDDFFETLAATSRRDGTTVLIASHNIAEIESIASHISLFDDGRVVLTDSLDHLRTRTRQVTLTFRDDVPEAIRAIDDFTALKTTARKVTGVVLDESTGAMERLKALDPADMEVRELTLKEIFVNFMRSRG